MSHAFVGAAVCGLPDGTMRSLSSIGGVGMDLGDARLIATIPVSDLERARSFYEGILGFRHAATSEAGVLLSAGVGRLLLYASSGVPPQHTLAGFEVDLLDPVMGSLRNGGVRFEDYDLPGLRTIDQVAWIGPERAAWFRDSEGNILSISESWRDEGPGGAGG